MVHPSRRRRATAARRCRIRTTGSSTAGCSSPAFRIRWVQSTSRSRAPTSRRSPTTGSSPATATSSRRWTPAPTSSTAPATTPRSAAAPGASTPASPAGRRSIRGRSSPKAGSSAWSARLNPFEARVQDFHAAATNTYSSMLVQLGERYEGDIAFNPDADNLNSIGLIEAYTTVLNRGKNLSVDGTPPIDYAPANQALLLVAARIADFYTLLGNEAYADAQDPIIGFATGQLGLWHARADHLRLPEPARFAALARSSLCCADATTRTPTLRRGRSTTGSSGTSPPATARSPTRWATTSPTRIRTASSTSSTPASSSRRDTATPGATT